MKVSRDVSRFIHFFLDQCLPPLLRDFRPLMYPLFRFALGPKARLFLDFKDKVSQLNNISLRYLYKNAASSFMQRKTDMNRACLQSIEKSIKGERGLDIACGLAYSAQKLSSRFRVTAADMNLDARLVLENPNIFFVEVDICKLPFQDKCFDTVMCAHTLEHVLDIKAAVAELRRVARKRLIIVVPRQRPYKYTFDLHVHLFLINGLYLLK